MGPHNHMKHQQRQRGRGRKPGRHDRPGIAHPHHGHLHRQGAEHVRDGSIVGRRLERRRRQAGLRDLARALAARGGGTPREAERGQGVPVRRRLSPRLGPRRQRDRRAGDLGGHLHVGGGLLERGQFAQIRPGARLYLRDVYDHVVHAIDMVETLRDGIKASVSPL